MHREIYTALYIILTIIFMYMSKYMYSWFDFLYFPGQIFTPTSKSGSCTVTKPYTQVYMDRKY